MPERKVKDGLDAWREAERHRDGLALDSSERPQAEEEVQNAAKVFHAEVAQASARYAEEDFQDRNPSPAELDRRPSGAGEPVVEVLAESRQR